MVSVDGGAAPADLMAEPPVRYRRSDPITRWAVWGFAGAAALGALLASGEPTGIAVIDAAWRVAFAVVLTLATARSRRWPAVWMAGIAAAFSSGIGLVLAIGAFLAAGAGVFSSLCNRVLGAATGALAAQALLRLPDIGWHGLASVVVAVAVVPVLVSAYNCSHRTTRRLVRRSLLVGLILLAVAVAGLGVAMLSAYPDLDQAVEATDRGRRALSDPDLDLAAEHFEQASASFRAAHRSLDAPWAMPAQLVPVLAQHRDVVLDSSGSGRALADSAAEVATVAPYQELRAAEGQVDLATVEKWQQPVADSVEVLDEVSAQLDEDLSPWLVAPLTEKLDEFAADVDSARPEAELASDALALSPAILGADGPRRYLVLFTSPAESRFLGGFSGAYGILNANGGKVTFDESGNIGDLNVAIEADRRVLPEWEGREEYEARYARFFPQRFLQNMTVSPDFPTDALVARDLYQQSTGQHLDGVLVGDPYALAGFLELAGPVRIDGLPQQLNGRNVVDYLLLDQYLTFQDDNEERRERLGDVADATFEALTTRRLPGPGRIGKVLAPAVHEKHLMVWMLDEEDQRLFDRMGADGRFEPGDGDFFSLRTANGGPNKIDSFLQRTIDYSVTFDPATGATDADVRIALANSAPVMLPDYVIGNSSGEPPGTNVMYLSFYSPLQLVSASRGGQPATTSTHRELGTNVYSMEVRIPPGGEVVLDLELSGMLEPSSTYELLASSQPMVNDDELTITVRPVESWSAQPTSELAGDEEAVTWTGALARDREWEVDFSPRP